MFAMLLSCGIYPLLYSVWLSFQERSRVTRQYEFVGLKQWQAAFADERMWHALGVTCTYTLVALALQLALGMALALLLDSDRRGYGFLRALMTLPLVVPPAVTGMMFLLMQDGQFGVLNYYMVQLGLIDTAHPLLATPSTALAGLMLADLWQWTPFMVLIFVAGLRALPKEPFEAAAIDGASALQQFRHLTLPMLGKVIAIAVLIRSVDLFRIYDYVYVMTGGGPGTTTETLSFYAGRVFGVANFPYAATLSLITLIVLNIGVTAVHAAGEDPPVITAHRHQMLRDLLAWAVVLVFMFPLAWWVLASFKPYTAIFNTTPVYVDFAPTPTNYEVTLLGRSRVEADTGVGGTAGGGSSYYSIPSILDSVTVALGATALTLVLADARGLWPVALPVQGPAARALLRAGAADDAADRGGDPDLLHVPRSRPARHASGPDPGAHADQPAARRAADEELLRRRAAGARRGGDDRRRRRGCQCFARVVLPLVRAASPPRRCLCFIFSWTEFLLSLQLTTSIRTIPVKISTFVTSTGTEWGFITALGSAAILPSFLFILLVQKHLVRGLTLGSLKD